MIEASEGLAARRRPGPEGTAGDRPGLLAEPGGGGDEADPAGRAVGGRVYAETCPHFLVLDESRYDLPDVLTTATPKGGGWVIDTPGVRSFGLAHVTPDDIPAAFDDLLLWVPIHLVVNRLIVAGRVRIACTRGRRRQSRTATSNRTHTVTGPKPRPG